MTVAVPSAEAPFATPAELERYADAVVRSGLAPRPGELVVVHAHPGHRAFVVALAEAAYRAGARHVEAVYDDPLVRAARIRHAVDEHLGPVLPWDVRRRRTQLRPDTGTIFVDGEVEPDALEGLPPDRVSEDYRRQVAATPWYLRAIMREERRSTIAAWPTPAWAAQVYPELDATEGRRRLLQDLLWFCRLGPDDPPGLDGWERHLQTLRDRAARLTELELARVELRAPGTELSFALSARTRWLGGLDTGVDGREYAANMPTEENYTSPDFRRTEGTFRCSKPLSLHGRTMEGLAGEFRGGSLVRLEAATDAQRDFLAAFLDADEGARRVGEVALVDAAQSRIGRTGRIYENTLVDENAAAHFAFGFGLGVAREPGDRAGARTVNRSTVHLDVMVGTDDLDAVGVRAAGERVPLLADGAWQL